MVGESHGTTLRRSRTRAGKLTEQDRAEIRRLYEVGEKQKDIAARFGVSRPHVSTIVKGCTSRRPLSANRERVEAMVRDGMSDTEIAETFRVTTTSVWKFRRATLNRNN